MKSLSKLSPAELEEVRKLGASVLRNPAINKERLTDVINEREPAINTPKPGPQDSQNEVATPEGLLAGRGNKGGDGASTEAVQSFPRNRLTGRTPNGRSREAYNTYMKGYMRAYRERSK